MSGIRTKVRGSISSVIILWLLTGAAALAQSPQRRTAQAPAPAAFEALTKRAEAARQADKLGEAIKLYQQAVRQKSNWVCAIS